MAFVTLDLETFYSDTFTLSKLTYDEYVHHPEFQIIGIGIKLDNSPTQWFSGTHAEIKSWLSGLTDWSQSCVLAHNAMFDATILEWVLGIKPAYYYDTLCMARALHGTMVGGSLGSLAKRYDLGEKGTEIIHAKGLRLEDFSPEGLHRYGDYCKNDVDLTYKLFQTMVDGFPQSELDLIDLTLRMYLRPVLQLDTKLLKDRLLEVQQDKQELLEALREELRCETVEDVRKNLASNAKFAELLRLRGGIPPTKLSLTTGKETFAFAKTDEDFIALQEHPDPVVQQLCAVRLGTKSTLEESRLERFIGIGARNSGLLPVPLQYYAAHTGRFGGTQGINLQNLPSRDKKKKSLKNAIQAPPGHVVINADSAQIEARIAAWISGQSDLLAQFARGEDVYCNFGSDLFGRTITRADEVERFISKCSILSLQYGVGYKKLQHSLKTQPPYVEIDDAEARRIVKFYRNAMISIAGFWEDCTLALRHIMHQTAPYNMGPNGCLGVSGYGIRLPNGMLLQYPNLRMELGQFTYDSRKGTKKIYGAALLENICQALARIIIADQMLAISKQHPVVLTVHDSVVCVVPEEAAVEVAAWIKKTMSVSPEWATGLPLACDVKYATSYGAC
jgi:DNA polymerase